MMAMARLAIVFMPGCAAMLLAADPAGPTGIGKTATIEEAHVFQILRWVSSLCPDGRTIVLASSRATLPGERKLALFRMGVSSLNLGPQKAVGVPGS